MSSNNPQPSPKHPPTHIRVCVCSSPFGEDGFVVVVNIVSSDFDVDVDINVFDFSLVCMSRCAEAEALGDRDEPELELEEVGMVKEG